MTAPVAAAAPLGAADVGAYGAARAVRAPAPARRRRLGRCRQPRPHPADPALGVGGGRHAHRAHRRSPAAPRRGRGGGAGRRRGSGARGIAHRILRPAEPPAPRSLQAAARAARYRLLEHWCAAEGVFHLLIAHNREDQAETLLLRLARGSGLDGLAGMAAVAEHAVPVAAAAAGGAARPARGDVARGGAGLDRGSRAMMIPPLPGSGCARRRRCWRRQDSGRGGSPPRQGASVGRGRRLRRGWRRCWRAPR